MFNCTIKAVLPVWCGRVIKRIGVTMPPHTPLGEPRATTVRGWPQFVGLVPSQES